MASGFQATPGQFLEGVVSTPPWELIRSAMAQKQLDFDNTMATTEVLRNALDIQHLPNKQAETAATLLKDRYNTEIDSVVNNMYKDPNGNHQQALKTLQGKLMQAKSKGGDIYKLEYPVKYLQEKKASDSWKEAAKKGSASYNEAINWYMYNLKDKTGLEADFDNPILDDVLHDDYDFQELTKNAKNILEASKKENKWDSEKGMYILTTGQMVEELTFDKVMGTLLGQLKLDSKYNSWATQKDKHNMNQTNYSDYSDWFTTVEQKDAKGNIVEVPTFNTKNSLISSLGVVAGGMAYKNESYETSFKGDDVKKMYYTEGEANRRHAQTLAQRDYEFKVSTALSVSKEMQENNRIFNDPESTPEQKQQALENFQSWGYINPYKDLFTIGGGGDGSSSLNDSVSIQSGNMGSIEAISTRGDLSQNEKIRAIQKGLQNSVGVTVDDHVYFKDLAKLMVLEGYSQEQIRDKIKSDIKNAASRKNGKDNLSNIPSVFRPYAKKLQDSWERDAKNAKTYSQHSTGSIGGISGGGGAISPKSAMPNADKYLDNVASKIVGDNFYGTKGKKTFETLYPNNAASTSQAYNLGADGNTITQRLGEKDIASQFSIAVDGTDITQTYIQNPAAFKLSGSTMLTDNQNLGLGFTLKSGGKTYTFKPNTDSEFFRAVTYKHLDSKTGSLRNIPAAVALKDQNIKIGIESLRMQMRGGGDTTNINKTIDATVLLPKGLSEKVKGYKVKVVGSNSGGRQYYLQDSSGRDIFTQPKQSEVSIIEALIEAGRFK